MIVAGGLLALPGERDPVRADLRVVDGVIAAVDRSDGGTPRLSPTVHEKIVDASGMIVLPGAVDPHVHFNDPGFTDREDFAHGTAAAASGGVTTVVDMPCTSIPPVTDGESLRTKLAAIAPQAVVDYGLYGGISGEVLSDDPERRVAELAPDVLGFKCYFVSGMETFARVDHRGFETALALARDARRPLLLHAEDCDYVTAATASARLLPDGPRAYYSSRPEAAEVLAVLAACELARTVGGDLHIVHVSTGRAAEIIAATDGVTGETGPHYLAFTLADFESAGAPLKVTPPVKQAPNREALWRALAEGALGFVASDHAPAPRAQKQTGSIWTDYAGIPGLPTQLPWLFSEGYLAGRIDLATLTAITAGNAAKRYGLADRKGALAVGRDADCVLVDPNATWTVRGDEFLSRGHVTPFEGMRLRGRVDRTIVRGRVVYDRRHGITVEGGYGQHQRRSA